VVKHYGPGPATGQDLLVPLQLAVRSAPAEDPRFVCNDMDLGQVFARGASVAVVGGPKFGCVGTVLEVSKSSKGKGEAVEGESSEVAFCLNVAVTPVPALDLGLGHSFGSARADRYVSTNDCAREVGMSQLAVSRITGAITVGVPASRGAEAHTLHLGLGVKFSGRGLRIVGYARRHTLKPQDGRPGRRVWQYSTKTIALLKALKARFPAFVNALSKAPDERVHAATLLFGTSQTMLNLRRVLKWLAGLEVASLPLVPDDMASLSGAAIRGIEAALEEAGARALRTPKPVVAKNLGAKQMVNVHTITKTMVPAGLTTRFSVGDRVRNIRPCGPVPFGAGGFVVTLRGSLAEVVFDTPLLAGSTLSGRLRTLRGATMETVCLLNLSKPPASARSAEEKAARKAAQAAREQARRSARP
jgi:hypothetical protein